MKALRLLMGSFCALFSWVAMGQDHGSGMPLAEIMAFAAPTEKAIASSPLARAVAALAGEPFRVEGLPKHCREAVVAVAKPPRNQARPATPLPSALLDAFAAVVDADDQEAIANEWVAISYGRFKQFSPSSSETALERTEAEAEYRRHLAERQVLRLGQRETRERLADLIGRPVSEVAAIDGSSLDDLPVPDDFPPLDALESQLSRYASSALEDLRRIPACKSQAERILAMARREVVREHEASYSRWHYEKTYLLPEAEVRLRLAELRLVQARDAHTDGQRPSQLAIRSTELADAQRKVRAVKAALQSRYLRFQEWSQGRSPTKSPLVAEERRP